MKQLIIGQNKAYATGVSYFDLTTLPEGTIGIFDPAKGELITSAEDLKNNVAIACGNASGKAPYHFPEVDVKSLTVEKAEYKAGSVFTATITIPTTEKGLQYTIIIAKKGTKLHERNTWTYTSIAKDDIATAVATDIVKQINANTNTSGVTATNSAGAITITAVSAPTIDQVYDYEVIGADELTGVKPTSVTPGKAEILGKEYVKDLASRCAAGKGFNYLAEDGKDLYPGYLENITEDQYVMYTLRFAVPRMSAKQRDEVVYQLVHIVVPVGAACIETLDTIFGISDDVSVDEDESEQ